MILESVIQNLQLEEFTETQLSGANATYKASDYPNTIVFNRTKGRPVMSDGEEWQELLRRDSTMSKLNIRGVNGVDIGSVYDPTQERNCIVDVTPESIGAATENHTHTHGTLIIDVNGNVVEYDTSQSIATPVVINADSVGAFPNNQPIPLEFIPAGALSELRVFKTKAAALQALASGLIQVGDTAIVDNVMYYVAVEYTDAGGSFETFFYEYVAGVAQKAQVADRVGHALKVYSGSNTLLCSYNGSETVSLQLNASAVGLGGVLQLVLPAQTVNYNGTRTVTANIAQHLVRHKKVVCQNFAVRGVVPASIHGCGTFPIVQTFNAIGDEIKLRLNIESNGDIVWKSDTGRAVAPVFNIMGLATSPDVVTLNNQQV